jgi:hypothetical protein
MRDERKKRDGQDGRELRLIHEPKIEVQDSKILKPRTWDLEPFLVSLVPPVSLSYPA